MRAWRRTAVQTVIGLIALGTGGLAHAADSVMLLLTEPNGAYAEAASAARRELGGAAEVTVRTAGTGSLAFQDPPRVVLALGGEACAELARSETPSATTPICALLPRAAFGRAVAQARADGRSMAALVLDQPISRQLALIRIALPDRDPVAVILGPESKLQRARLEEMARLAKMRVQIGEATTADDLAPTLTETLRGAGVLLALPDATVYSGQTIQSILLTAFRSRVPMVAFSQAYVRAGALLALYSTPEQIGQQAGQMVRAALAGRAPALLNLPRDFVVGVNRDVARSLDIRLASDAALLASLRALEGTR